MPRHRRLFFFTATNQALPQGHSDHGRGPILCAEHVRMIMTVTSRSHSGIERKYNKGTLAEYLYR